MGYFDGSLGLCISALIDLFLRDSNAFFMHVFLMRIVLQVLSRGSRRLLSLSHIAWTCSWQNDSLQMLAPSPFVRWAFLCCYVQSLCSSPKVLWTFLELHSQAARHALHAGLHWIFRHQDSWINYWEEMQLDKSHRSQKKRSRKIGRDKCYLLPHCTHLPRVVELSLLVSHNNGTLWYQNFGKDSYI